MKKMLSTKNFLNCLLLIGIFFIIPKISDASIVGVASSASPQSGGLSRGLVGYWTFDGRDMVNGTIRDVSGKGNHGSAFNISTSTFYVVGKVGQGVLFDADDDRIQVNASATLNDIETQGGGGLTVSVWLNPRSDGEGGAGDIVLKGNAANGGWRISNIGNGRYQFLKDYDGTNLSVATPNNTRVVNTWQHLVFTWDGSATATNVNIYKDGVLLARGADVNGTGNKVSDSSNLLIVGNQNAATTFDGKMDNIRIYNRILSTTEIRQLYNVGAATKQAVSAPVTATSTCSVGLSCGLVGYWTFDGKDTLNGRISDISGNGSHGYPSNISTSTFYAAGKIGQAGNFNGANNSVTVAAGTILSPSTGDFSISLWAKLTEIPAGNDSFINDSNSTNNDSYSMSITTLNRSSCAFRDNTTIVTATEASQGLLPTINKWAHYVCIRQGTNVSLYRDGVLLSTNSNAGLVDVDTEASFNMQIGAGIGTGATSIPAVIDDVRIYNRVLSTTEMNQLYAMGAATKQAVSAPVTATTSCSVGLSCGLVGYWTFDGKDMLNGVARDVSGNRNHGYPLNIATSTFYTPGKVGQGLRFDGVDDYVNTSLNTSAVIGGTDFFSVSAWIKPISFPLNSGGIVEMGTGASAIGQINFEVNGTSILCRVGNSGLTQAVSIPLNKWTYVACVNNNKSLTIYVNNTTFAGTTSNTPLSSSIHSLHIGYWFSPTDTTRFFNGTIDNVRIYNRALSSTEINQLYGLGR